MFIQTTPLSNKHIATIRYAARKLTGDKRRAFQAQVAVDYMDSNARLAEKTFGWCRHTVTLGLHETRTGIVCISTTKHVVIKKRKRKTNS